MRRSPALAAVSIALSGALAAGCQNYNFNPVDRCILQPGSERLAVSKVSTADVLFVVDDSGSMAGEQAKLAAAFDAFITSLNAYNDKRVASGLEPFDFHIAITTTSVFYNRPSYGIQDHYVFNKNPKPCSAGCSTGYTCAATCGTASNVCCSGGTPELVVSCNPGIAQDGAEYPRGSFVGLGSNPRVLHFDKRLYGTDQDGNGTWEPVTDTTNATNTQGFTRQQLKNFFKANVNVGTCGSGQEQGLEAARRAVNKALAGTQKDMRDRSGQIVAAPGVTADWPHDGAKLVVVWVGDEDDCSAPEDPVTGIVLTGSAGSDACVQDTAKPLDQQKQFRVQDFVRDLQALGRPVGAAFVISASQTTCVDEACTAGKCSDAQCLADGGTAQLCGGQGPGTRFLQAAAAMRLGGVGVVSASICDPGTPKACTVPADCAGLSSSTCQDGTTLVTGRYCRLSNGTPAGTDGFAPILSRIAEIVKPPSSVELPTQPADSAVTVLRITARDGSIRKSCIGPAEPPLTFDEARAAGFDWWFTATRDQFTVEDRRPSDASRFIYINHETQRCVPNSGESYSAAYLGQVPEGGCTSDADCAEALSSGTSSTETKWTCFTGLEADGVCAPLDKPGTCVCGDRAEICPKG